MTQQPFHVIIPARLKSTRLAEKVLLDIHGKPMIQHVVERAKKSAAASVTVATDDERIKKAVESFGGQVCMTSVEHVSGTDRIAEAIAQLGFLDDTVIVNVQGDEPLLPWQNINQVAANFMAEPEILMATLCEEIQRPELIFNPNVVKVVRDHEDYALYFSRAPIPWDQVQFPLQTESFSPRIYYRHIGIYAAKASFISDYVKWPRSPLEEVESLEQLRILFRGGRIHVAEAMARSEVSVDTLEDIQFVRAYLDGLKTPTH